MQISSSIQTAFLGIIRMGRIVAAMESDSQSADDMELGSQSADRMESDSQSADDMESDSQSEDGMELCSRNPVNSSSQRAVDASTIIDILGEENIAMFKALTKPDVASTSYCNPIDSNSMSGIIKDTLKYSVSLSEANKSLPPISPSHFWGMALLAHALELKGPGEKTLFGNLLERGLMVGENREGIATFETANQPTDIKSHQLIIAKKLFIEFLQIHGIYFRLALENGRKDLLIGSSHTMHIPLCKDMCTLPEIENSENGVPYFDFENVIMYCSPFLIHDVNHDLKMTLLTLIGMLPNGKHVIPADCENWPADGKFGKVLEIIRLKGSELSGITGLDECHELINDEQVMLSMLVPTNGAMKSTVNAMNGSMDALRRSMDALKESMDAMKGSTDATKESINATKESMDALRGSMDALKRTIDDNKTANEARNESENKLGYMSVTFTTAGDGSYPLLISFISRTRPARIRIVLDGILFYDNLPDLTRALRFSIIESVEIARRDCFYCVPKYVNELTLFKNKNKIEQFAYISNIYKFDSHTLDNLTESTERFYGNSLKYLLIESPFYQEVFSPFDNQTQKIPPFPSSIPFSQFVRESPVETLVFRCVKAETCIGGNVEVFTNFLCAKNLKTLVLQYSFDQPQEKLWISVKDVKKAINFLKSSMGNMTGWDPKVAKDKKIIIAVESKCNIGLNKIADELNLKTCMHNTFYELWPNKNPRLASKDLSNHRKACKI